MLLHELVETSRAVAATPSRSEKIERLAALLRRLEPGEVEIAVWFLAGSPLQGRLGIGKAALRKAWPEAAAAPALTLSAVHAAFGSMAAASGKGSAGERARLLAEMLGSATAEEQDFLGRLLMGELRQGALEALVVEAVARAASLPIESVRKAAMRAGDAGEVAAAALTGGAAGLERFAIRLFAPVQPMLAQPAEDPEEALERLGEAALEWKLDGGRIQVHRDGDEVRVYSRTLREVTRAVPEVVEAARLLPVTRFIADGEVIALRPDGSPQPFQTTMKRFGRRLDVEVQRRELPLTPFLFDLLYLGGEDISAEPQRRRFEELSRLAPSLVVPHAVMASPEEARRFFRETLARGHEGLVAKNRDAPYEAGRRGGAWLKLKQAHTLDLVILAAEWGHGRRQGWLSNLHLGARDPAGGFVMLGKTFKGLTDEMLKWQTERLLELAAVKEKWAVQVRPELVAEIAFSDVQESPRYPGGLALRFARVKRYRTDKTAAEADTIDTVRAIYRAGGGGRG